MQNFICSTESWNTSDVQWWSTPLGAMSTWPERLKTLASFLTKSSVSSCLFWGENLTMVTNSAWQKELGPRSPRLCGMPAGSVSPDLERACRSALYMPATCNFPELRDALMPLMWRALSSDGHAVLYTTPVVDSDGNAEGVLVQLCVSPSGDALDGASARPRSNSAFMIRLTDELRRAFAPDHVQTLGTRLLGLELGVDRASFSTVDLRAGRASERLEYRRDEDAPSQAFEHVLSDFGPALRLLENGMPLVIRDLFDRNGQPSCEIADEVLRYAHAQFRAQLTVPIHRNERLVAVITLRRDVPHRWTADDIALTHKAGIRIWEAIERARAEATAAESAARFKALVTTSSYAVYRMSPDWKEMWHLDGNGILPDASEPNTNWIDQYIYDEDQPEILARIKQAIADRTMFELEHRVKRPDGKPGWVLSRAVPITDIHGAISEWFGAAADLTERKQHEIAARTAERELLERTQAADARKSRLIAVLAHDLRTPLVALLGSLDIVRDNSDRTAQHEAIDRMALEGHNMLQLIDDVLELARLRAGEAVLRLAGR